MAAIGQIVIYVSHLKPGDVCYANLAERVDEKAHSNELASLSISAGTEILQNSQDRFPQYALARGYIGNPDIQIVLFHEKITGCANIRVDNAAFFTIFLKVAENPTGVLCHLRAVPVLF
jgi:hypothetical protein